MTSPSPLPPGARTPWRVAHVTGLNWDVVAKELRRLSVAGKAKRQDSLDVAGKAFVLYRTVSEPEPRHLNAASDDGGAG